jgi:replicative DNA helicase
LDNSRNEDYILISLVNNGAYLSKVIGKIKPEYFENYNQQEVYKVIKTCIAKDSSVTFDTLKMMINNQDSGTDEQKEELIKYVDSIKAQNIDIAFPILMEQTEKWAKTNSFKNSMLKSIQLISKDQSNKTFSEIMGVIEDALNIKFSDDEYSMSYNNPEDRLRRFRALKMENTILSGFKPWDDLTGGIRKKTLNCILAPTNHGKTLSMAFLAACFLIQGLNVYIASLEISPEEYLSRIDANILDISTYDMSLISEEKILSRFKKFDENNADIGDIKCHQFGEATAIDIKMDIKKLYIEEKFTPDVVIIDYIGLMDSIHVKDRGNTYVSQKEISREVRQKICVGMGFPVISAVQTNRPVENRLKEKGKDIEITSADTADSYGVPPNLDTYISQIEIKNGAEQYMTNDLTSMYLWRLIKSRNHVCTGTRSMVGVSKNKQRLIDINMGNLDVQIINNNVDNIQEKMQKENDWFAQEFGDIK